MSTPIQVKIVRAGKEIGTYEAAEVLRLLGLGTLKPTDIYWHEGMGGWELLSKLDVSEGLRLPAEPEVKSQSDNESKSITWGACWEGVIRMGGQRVGGYFSHLLVHCHCLLLH